MYTPGTSKMGVPPNTLHASFDKARALVLWWSLVSCRQVVDITSQHWNSRLRLKLKSVMLILKNLAKTKSQKKTKKGKNQNLRPNVNTLILILKKFVKKREKLKCKAKCKHFDFVSQEAGRKRKTNQKSKTYSWSQRNASRHCDLRLFLVFLVCTERTGQ